MESLELTDEMIERNDEIDNAIYEMILVLLEEDEDSLPWDMAFIGDVTDAVIEELQRIFNRKVRHPAVVTELNGNQYYSEYDD